MVDGLNAIDSPADLTNITLWGIGTVTQISEY